MRLTVKGQVTIPISVRRGLGLDAGSEVVIELAGDHAEIRPVIVATTGRGARLLQGLVGAADPGVTTAEIMAMTRGDVVDDPGLV